MPTSDDDSECTHEACGLIVCDDALRQVSIECPAPPCKDDGNSDGRCVMVPSKTGPLCSYCGQRGSYVDPDDVDADDLSVLA